MQRLERLAQRMADSRAKTASITHKVAGGSLDPALDPGPVPATQLTPIPIPEVER